jgi:hypothetical protein
MFMDNRSSDLRQIAKLGPDNIESVELVDSPSEGAKLQVNRMSSGRVGVVVLGMHRSGTSALARVLNLLGCALPETLMATNAANTAGYWESDVLVNFNDELLNAAGTEWQDWLPVNPGFSKSPAYPSFIKRAGQLLRQEFGDSPLFVLKDPRNCRLVPFWLEVLGAEHVRPAVVLPLRNPLEVARSLHERDDIDEDYALLMWLRHVLEAEAGSRGQLRVFTTYDELLGPWDRLAMRMQDGLGFSWPRVSPIVEGEIAGFLDLDRRHHAEDPGGILTESAVSDWVRQSYAVMLRWAQQGEDQADYPALDQIAAAFNEASGSFARLVLQGSRAQTRMRQLEGELAGANERAAGAQWHEQQLAELYERLAEADSTALRLGAEAREAEARAGQAGSIATSALEKITSLTLLRDELDAERDQALTQLQALRDAQQDDAHRVFDLESTLLQREEEIEQAWAALTAERQIVAGLGDELDSLGQRNAALSRKLTEADGWVFQLAGERQATEKAYARLGRLVTEEASRRAAAEGRVERVQDLLAAEQAKAAALRIGIATSAQDLDRADSENHKLRAYLAALNEEAETKARDNAQDKARSDGQNQVLRDELGGLHSALDGNAQNSDRNPQDDSVVRAELAKAHAQLAAVRNQAAAELAFAESAKHDTAAKLHDRFGEIAMLTQNLREQEERYERRSGETAVLTQALREQRAQNERSADGVKWLSQVHATLARRPYWWSLLPGPWRREREYRKLLLNGLFDGKNYLARYRDVADQGIDPLRHYIMHGMAEGRER